MAGWARDSNTDACDIRRRANRVGRPGQVEAGLGSGKKSFSGGVLRTPRGCRTTLRERESARVHGSVAHDDAVHKRRLGEQPAVVSTGHPGARVKVTGYFNSSDPTRSSWQPASVTVSAENSVYESGSAVPGFQTER
jgi:hypothetical protein